MKHLFLLAWVEGSDSASGEKTRVHSPKDLWPQFVKGNEHIFSVVVETNKEKVAAAFGYQHAFFDNYKAHDSVSTCLKITKHMIRLHGDKLFPKPIKDCLGCGYPLTQHKPNEFCPGAVQA